MQQSDLGLNLSTQKTRKREFLEQMQQVVPWKELVALIAPYAPEGRKGRPPFPMQMLLRIHFMQQWFTLSDPAMEEALHDLPLFRDFAGLSWDRATPDASTILRFGKTPSPRHLLEKHKLCRANPEGRHRLAGEQKAAAALRHHRGCHVDCCTQFHQEQHQIA